MDHYLDLQQQHIGGISLNFAVRAKRCGAESVSLVSAIGNDHYSHILKKLAQEGIDASHVMVRPGATAHQNIALTANGERIFPPGGYSPGVLDGYHLDGADLSFVQHHNLVASAMFKQTEPLFRQVMETLPFDGWHVADFLDLSDYNRDIGVVERLSRSLTIAFISGDHELVEQLRPLSRETQCLIVVTLGEQGSMAIVKGEPIIQSSLKVDRVVDSTGCGDAFQAAFTVSYWRDKDVRRALECGTQQAARALQHYGAID